MYTLWQAGLGKLGKGAGETAFIGNAVGTGEAAESMIWIGRSAVDCCGITCRWARQRFLYEWRSKGARLSELLAFAKPRPLADASSQGKLAL